MTQTRDDIVGLDAAILMHPTVWEASGHVAGFTDPMVECRCCRRRYRADQLDASGADACAAAPGRPCDLTEPRAFNLMMHTQVGALEASSTRVWLRPETAQGIYVNARHVWETARVQVPFGIAQVGKAFRNEVTPGHLLFRLHEFEQMKMQYFVHPAESDAWFTAWRSERARWHAALGLDADRLRVAPHAPHELAHYARAAADVTYDFADTLGFQEIEGIRHRGDYDLQAHAARSGSRATYTDPVTGETYVPHVVETSVGLDRLVLALLANSYRVEHTPNGSERTVLRLRPDLAPVTATVLPMTRHDDQPETAERLAADLREHWTVTVESRQSIGKRYRLADEIGTPWCITVDATTAVDDTVTVRHRDTLEQVRVSTSAVSRWIRDAMDALPRLATPSDVLRARRLALAARVPAPPAEGPRPTRRPGRAA